MGEDTPAIDQNKGLIIIYFGERVERSILH